MSRECKKNWGLWPIYSWNWVFEDLNLDFLSGKNKICFTFFAHKARVDLHLAIFFFKDLMNDPKRLLKLPVFATSPKIWRESSRKASLSLRRPQVLGIQIMECQYSAVPPWLPTGSQRSPSPWSRWGTGLPWCSPSGCWGRWCRGRSTRSS